MDSSSSGRELYFPINGSLIGIEPVLPPLTPAEVPPVVFDFILSKKEEKDLPMLSNFSPTLLLNSSNFPSQSDFVTVEGEVTVIERERHKF